MLLVELDKPHMSSLSHSASAFPQLLHLWLRLGTTHVHVIGQLLALLMLASREEGYDSATFKKKKEKKEKRKKKRKERKRLCGKPDKIQTGHFRVLIIKKKEHREQHELSFFVLGAQVVKPVTQTEKKKNMPKN